MIWPKRWPGYSEHKTNNKFGMPTKSREANVSFQKSPSTCYFIAVLQCTDVSYTNILFEDHKTFYIPPKKILLTFWISDWLSSLVNFSLPVEENTTTIRWVLWSESSSKVKLSLLTISVNICMQKVILTTHPELLDG